MFWCSRCRQRHRTATTKLKLKHGLKSTSDVLDPLRDTTRQVIARYQNPDIGRRFHYRVMLTACLR
jgi:hypothetical protein